jgi:hypothetical protein
VRSDSALRAASIVALLLGAATAAGAVWSVAAGERSGWTLLLVPFGLVFWWWVAMGLRRRADDPRRGTRRG